MWVETLTTSATVESPWCRTLVTSISSLTGELAALSRALPYQKLWRPRPTQLIDRIWRPVRESNPCRRREREATYGNSTELRGMDSTLSHLKDSRELLLDA